MATPEIKTIKPAGGGDYSSLGTWEAAERINLVTADKIKVAEVYSGGNCIAGNTETLIWDPWVMDATHYVEIRAAAGHEHTGVWSTSKAYGSIVGSRNPIWNTKILRITRMQFSSTAGSTIYHNAANEQTTICTTLIDKCILKASNPNNAVGGTVVIGGIKSGSVTIQNSVIIDTGGGGHIPISMNSVNATATNIYLYNNTIINLGDANTSWGTLYVQAPLTMVCQNNYYYCKNGQPVYGTNSEGTFSKGANDATYNTEATTANLRSIPYSTATFQDVTAGSENLRLVVSSSNKLLDNGANLTGSGVTADIIGTARPQFGTFDIGAFENDIPLCWNYTAHYKNSNKLFKASGCGPFPRNLQVPSNVDISTGKMVDDGISISPDRYNIT